MGGPLIDAEIAGIQDIVDGGTGIVELVNNGGTFTARVGDRNTFEPLFRGAWVTATAYSVNDIVESGGSSYVATSTHTSAAATEPGVGASWQDVWTLFQLVGFVKKLTSSIDNRLVKTSGTAGDDIEQTGITVDDSNNVSGVGTLTANALSSPALTRNVSNSTLFLGADTVSTIGANYILYGSAHATQANDHVFRRGAAVLLQYDHSLAHWNFQNLPVEGVNQLVLQGARHIHSNNATSFVTVSGGDDGPNGGNVLMYGASHATLAGDIYFRSSAVSRMFWDESLGIWSLNSNPLSGIGRMDMNAGPEIHAGSGTPESAVTAPVGSIFLRSDGGASTTLYVKESGAGNTGWVAK